MSTLSLSPAAASIDHQPRLRVLSLGAGVQSTTLALMAARRDIDPMPDCAIFADTGWEPEAVYDHLDWLMSPGVLPFPVHIVSAGNLRDNVLESCKPQGGRFTAVPFFSREVLPAGSVQPVYDEEASGGPDGEASGALVQVGTRTLVRDEYRDGIGKRQCTHEFKIAPITKKLRALLGYAPRRRIPVGSVEVWLGISLDEAIRMKPSRTAWQVNRWPLVEARLSRQDCLSWLRRHGYPQPPKSACIGCPYHSDAVWRQIRDTDPQGWNDAVSVDRALRAGGPCRGMRALQYMHSSRQPLDEVDLSTAEDRGQINLFINECDGMCGV